MIYYHLNLTGQGPPSEDLYHAYAALDIARKVHDDELVRRAEKELSNISMDE